MADKEINTVLNEANLGLAELSSGIWAVGECISETTDLHTSGLGSSIVSMAKRLSAQASEIEQELRSLGLIV